MDNPCYHCYAGATEQCSLTPCKFQFESWSKDLEAEEITIPMPEDTDKYRWHDLRKNPEDLPKEYENVLVYHKYWHFRAEEMRGEYEVAYYGCGMFCFDGGSGQGNENIAWRYIEPFEEENINEGTD